MSREVAFGEGEGDLLRGSFCLVFFGRNDSRELLGGGGIFSIVSFLGELSGAERGEFSKALYLFWE